MTPSTPSLPVPDLDTLRKAVSVLGRKDSSEAQREREITELVQNPMTARRVLDWFPEIFGLVFLPHLGKFILPTQFSARNRHGQWMSFDFKAEPLFEPLLRLGMELYHSEDRSAFGLIALRSSLVDVVNKALNAGQSLDGAVLSGPSMLGIPAEVYAEPKASWWRKLLG